MRCVCFAAVAALACAGTPAPAASWSVAYAPEANLEHLDVALIETAKTRIDIAAYVLTDVAVIDALAAAAGRGVKVRIYRDKGQDRVAVFVADHLRTLVAAPGVEVRTKENRALMHLKSFAVDDRVLRGGAANFTASGLKHQDNDRWETDDPSAVAGFERKFEGDVGAMITPNLDQARLLEPKRAVLFCSFCGRSRHETVYLIAGPSVGICDECVDQANDMVARWREANGKAKPA